MKKMPALVIKNIFESEGFKINDNEARVIRLAAGTFEKCRHDIALKKDLGKWGKRLSNYKIRLEHLKTMGKVPYYKLEWEGPLPVAGLVEPEPVLQFHFPSTQILKVR
jgi:hypothetical protein